MQPSDSPVPYTEQDTKNILKVSICDKAANWQPAQIGNGFFISADAGPDFTLSSNVIRTVT